MNEYTSDQIKHSAAHILAMAAIRVFPDTRIGIGPVTKDGFYYEFEFAQPLVWDQIKRIESEINLIIQEDLPFNQVIVPKESAFQILLTRGQVYKAELLQDIPDAEISFYKTGEEFIDLCRGPHVRSTGDIGAIKITSITSTHWKGNPARPKMQRVSGVAFKDIAGLRTYLEREEQMNSRDFRNLAREMAITLGTSRQIIYTPKGARIIKSITNTILDRLSGDSEEAILPNYKTVSEVITGLDEVFGRKNRSYRELPLKLIASSRMELIQPIQIMGKEAFSVGAVCQRVYHDQSQFHSQLTSAIYAIVDILKSLELDCSTIISVPSQTHIGLEIASNQFKRIGMSQTQIIDASMHAHQLAIQFNCKDSFDRECEIVTLRLDSGEAQYVAKTGDFAPTLQITCLWIVERILAFYLEELEGGFPLWLSPTQAMIIPITEEQTDFSERVFKQLKDQGLRVDIDNRSETMQSRIRDAELQKIPVILIVGEKEASTNTVSLRVRNKAEVGLVDIEGLFQTLTELKI